MTLALTRFHRIFVINPINKETKTLSTFRILISPNPSPSLSVRKALEVLKSANLVSSVDDFVFFFYLSFSFQFVFWWLSNCVQVYLLIVWHIVMFWIYCLRWAFGVLLISLLQFSPLFASSTPSAQIWTSPVLKPKTQKQKLTHTLKYIMGFAQLVIGPAGSGKVESFTP